MMKHKNLILTALAAAMVLTGAMGSAYSYFTTNAEAAGAATISLGSRTEVQEEFSNWTKHVTVTSTEDSEPVYVRVKAFCGSEYSLVYSDSEGNWTPGSDGYYYYTKVLPESSTTPNLFTQVTIAKDIPDDVLKDFNIYVEAESIQVGYFQDYTEAWTAFDKNR